MTWLWELQAALGEAGITGRARRRIVTELADHLACDPSAEARLGSPAELAGQFAAALRLRRTSRSAYSSFAALALVALGLLVTTSAFSAAGGWPTVPGLGGRLLVPLAGCILLLAPQVAFAAGMLGIVRAVRIRRLPAGEAGELRLVQRRMAVANAAGVLTAAALLVHVATLWSLMPVWWDAVALASATVPLFALALAGGAIRAAHAVTPEGSATAGLGGDVPARLVPLVSAGMRHPARLSAAVGMPLCVLMLAVTARAESSLAAGAFRAALEAVVFFGCFALLGRPLGLRRS